MADKANSCDTDSLDGPDTESISSVASSGQRSNPSDSCNRMAPMPHPALAQVAALDDLDNLSNNLSDLTFSSKDSGIGSYVSGSSAGRQEPVRNVEPGNDSTSLERKHIEDLIRYGHRKLGYSENEVIAVIKQRGTAITRNQLMEGLTQLGERPSHGEVNPRRPTSWPVDRSEDRVESGNQDSNKPEPQTSAAQTTENNLRTIVIDGSNVAMAHGNNVEYSCRGIRIVADYFKERGHEKIIVFVPHDKFKSDKVKDQHILKDLRKQNIIVKTPSKKLEQKKITPYDDRFILQIATKEEGIVVSNDSFKDLLREGKIYQETITKRVLPYTFQQDNFIPAEDPLGRRGPHLDQFLRRRPLEVENNTCPYGRRCTFGNKCKYHHPERDPLGTSLSNNSSDEGSSWSNSGSENQRRHSHLIRARSAADSVFVSTSHASQTTSPNSPQGKFPSIPGNSSSNRTETNVHSQSAGSTINYQRTQHTHVRAILTRSHSPSSSRNNRPSSNSVAEQLTRPGPTDLQTGESNSDTDLINPTPERLALRSTLVTTFQPSLVLTTLNENPGISAQMEILPLLMNHLMQQK